MVSFAVASLFTCISLGLTREEIIPILGDFRLGLPISQLDPSWNSVCDGITSRKQTALHRGTQAQNSLEGQKCWHCSSLQQQRAKQSQTDHTNAAMPRSAARSNVTFTNCLPAMIIRSISSIVSYVTGPDIKVLIQILVAQ